MDTCLTRILHKMRYLASLDGNYTINIALPWNANNFEFSQFNTLRAQNPGSPNGPEISFASGVIEKDAGSWTTVPCV